MSKKYYLFIALVLGGLAIFGYQVAVSSSSGLIESTKKVVARPIPTVQVEEFQHVQQHTFPGSVQAKARVDLAFNVAGQIIEANIPEGSRFAKGEVLARLDPRDFQHSYDASLANAVRVEKEFQRIRILKKKEVVSQAEYDGAKSAHDVAQAELSIRKKALNDTVLHAPFDGVVAKRYIENYQHIKERTNILSFKDISRIEVVVQVPETIVAHATEGFIKNIGVKFDADKRTMYPGVLKEYALQSDPVSRTFKVVVEVAQPDNLNILPGMTATVSSEIDPVSGTGFSGIVAHTLVVPGEAIFHEQGNSFCWVIPEAGGVPQKREVEVGMMRDQGSMILAGLTRGEYVAVAGLSNLHEGLQVRPAKKDAEGLDG